MKRLDEFRIFYNHTIHPELMRMEQHRKRLLWLFAISSVMLLGLIIFELYINILVITLAAILPIALYLTWLYYQARAFRQKFKPNVVRLILDFVDDSLNFGELSYDGEWMMGRAEFLGSQVFATSAPIYEGEDYIAGKIGNMQFELSEILVQEFSKVDQRIQTVFKGIFLQSTFSFKLEGRVLILPKYRRQYLSRGIRQFIQSGGQSVDNRMSDAHYKQLFQTFADQKADIRNLLSVEMQTTIADYCTQNDKVLYISFINSTINIFMEEEDDFLEPFLFRPNVSFDLVQNFFEDIRLVVNIIEDFDRLY
ncbi:MAG: DUF3137 domain-containing protein [Bacteroidota bacterium]